MFEFKYEGVEMEEQNKMIELKDAELVKKLFYKDICEMIN